MMMKKNCDIWKNTETGITATYGENVYLIHDIQRRIDFPPMKKYALYRENDNAYLDCDGEIVCGNAKFNACGLPMYAVFDTVEEAKKLVEELENRHV